MIVGWGPWSQGTLGMGVLHSPRALVLLHIGFLGWGAAGGCSGQTD